MRHTAFGSEGYESNNFWVAPTENNHLYLLCSNNPFTFVNEGLEHNGRGRCAKRSLARQTSNEPLFYRVKVSNLLNKSQHGSWPSLDFSTTLSSAGLATRRQDSNSDTTSLPGQPEEQPIRSRYLGHVTGYQPIRDQSRFLLKRLLPGKQPIRTHCLGHVTGYQPIRDHHLQFLVNRVMILLELGQDLLISVFAHVVQQVHLVRFISCGKGCLLKVIVQDICESFGLEPTDTSKQPIWTHYLGHVTGYQPIRGLEISITGKQPIRTHCLGHVTGYQPIRDQFISCGSSRAVRAVSSKSLYKISEPTDTSQQPIWTHYLGHVTGYQLIRGQCFLIRSVPGYLSHYYRGVF
eukprot:sb/3466245/